MKLLTKEETEAHYHAVVQGGLYGGALGLTLGLGGTMLATRRYPAFRSLTLPFKAFLVTSTGTFFSIVNAERASHRFGASYHPERDYRDESEMLRQAALARRPLQERALEWARRNRYGIVLGSWTAGIVGAMTIVGRNRYLSTAQKVVQARVYAQGLTLAVLLITGLLEVKDAKSGVGRWETVMVLDPNDPEHKHLIEKRIHKEEYAGQDLWKDMVAAEERRLAEIKSRRDQDATKN